MNTPKIVVGVTSLNNLVGHFSDLIDNGIDLRWEEINLEVREEILAENPNIEEFDLEDEIEERLQDFESDSDTASVLVGDWMKDYSGKYVPDLNGPLGFAAHYSGFCGGSVAVEYSKTLKNCNQTSPCFVMADGSGTCGDLDTSGSSKLAYSLPAEYFLG